MTFGDHIQPSTHAFTRKVKEALHLDPDRTNLRLDMSYGRNRGFYIHIGRHGETPFESQSLYMDDTPEKVAGCVQHVLYMHGCPEDGVLIDGTAVHNRDGLMGSVIKSHNSHGLSYDVRHPDGTIRSYEPEDLEMMP